MNVVAVVVTERLQAWEWKGGNPEYSLQKITGLREKLQLYGWRFRIARLVMVLHSVKGELSPNFTF